MSNTKHEDVMAMLEAIPEVKEETTSLRVQLAIAVLNKRLELGLTQEALVKLVSDRGLTITQATISKIEGAESDIKISSYEKVFNALDLYADVVSMRKKQIASRHIGHSAATIAAINARQAMGKTSAIQQYVETAPAPEVVFHHRSGRIGSAAAKIVRSKQPKATKVKVRPYLRSKSSKLKNQEMQKHRGL